MPAKTPKPAAKKKDSAPPPAEEKFQQVDVSTTNPSTVVLMLDSPETAIVVKACQALHKYAEKSEQNCVELKELDIIPRLVNLLSSPDKVTRAHAIICLSPMTAHKLIRRALYKIECIPQLLSLLKPEEELMSQERASFTISQLAEEYSFKVELHKHSSHSPLVQLLQSTSDADVQRNGAKALCLLVENYQARPSFMDAGGIPVVLELLASEYATIQELALKTLHSCMHNADCRSAILEGDGLAKIVAFIGNKDYSDLHALGVSVLALCLEDATSMVALQGSGCLDQLLSHITSGTDPLMKTSAAKAIAKAANNSVNRKILHEQEVEKTFLDLLSADDPGVIVAGCEGLTAMACLGSSRQRVGQEDGVARLVRCLGREEGVVRAAAVEALAQVITEAPANCKLLSSCSGVEALVQLLADAEAFCREFAANCITSMAPDDSLRAELGTGGAVSALVGCLDFADSAVQASSVEALGMLACDSVARIQLCSSSGVAPLLALLGSESEAVLSRALWALAVCAQSTDVAETACQMGALEQVEKLMKTAAHKASAKAALDKLLHNNLSAKYWISEQLSHTDIIRDCEFFDAGKARSSSRPFTPLSDLVTQPLNQNHPILTVSLLAKPPPQQQQQPATMVAAGSGGVGGQEDVATAAPTEGSSTSVGGRSKSRQAPRDGKSKKLKADRETESRVSEESEEVARSSPEKLPGLLQPDSKLWAHITHTLTHIQPLTSIREQVQQLAKYVGNSLGGEIEKSGAFGFELPVGELQQSSQSNLVPLGEVTVGSFQHRALLFKVLCDQLGVACSLVRGNYSRHWNEVYIVEEQGVTNTSDHVITTKERRPKCYIVDLMFNPGELLPASTSLAVQYQHI